MLRKDKYKIKNIKEYCGSLFEQKVKLKGHAIFLKLL